MIIIFTYECFAVPQSFMCVFTPLARSAVQLPVQLVWFIDVKWKNTHFIGFYSIWLKTIVGHFDHFFVRSTLITNAYQSKMANTRHFYISCALSAFRLVRSLTIGSYGADFALKTTLLTTTNFCRQWYDYWSFASSAALCECSDPTSAIRTGFKYEKDPNLSAFDSDGLFVCLFSFAWLRLYFHWTCLALLGTSFTHNRISFTADDR